MAVMEYEINRSSNQWNLQCIIIVRTNGAKFRGALRVIKQIKNKDYNRIRKNVLKCFFNKQSTTQPHQIHGPHFFFPFRYGT
jgi:hypothetical protein